MAANRDSDLVAMFLGNKTLDETQDYLKRGPRPQHSAQPRPTNNAKHGMSKSSMALAAVFAIGVRILRQMLPSATGCTRDTPLCAS
jgi:hypothetical protein